MTVVDFVDTHAHFWQVSSHDWYPGLRAGRPSLHHDYLPTDYQADATGAGVRVTGLVHVSATSAPGAFLAETRWLEEIRRQTPSLLSAIIGAVDPLATAGEMERQLVEQKRTGAFRGVRILSGFDATSAATAVLLRLLAEHDLIFDQAVAPRDMAGYAVAVADAPDTAIVLEHAGWPDEGPTGFGRWRAWMTEFAAMPHVDCKISGLGVVLGTTDVEEFRPYVETCLELFGVQRCFVGSNFPVDRLGGRYPDLLASYLAITAPLGADVQRALFSTNAVRRYRIQP